MKHFAIIILCTVCALVGFLLGKNVTNSVLTNVVKVSDTMLIYDTIRIAAPSPAYIRKGPNRIELLSVAQNVNSDADSTQLPDSIAVNIPIDTAVYVTPDFRAVVSGFNARLDTIAVYKNEKIITQTSKPKKWAVSCGIGLTAGHGGVKPGIYVGIGYVLHSF